MGYKQNFNPYDVYEVGDVSYFTSKGDKLTIYDVRTYRHLDEVIVPDFFGEKTVIAIEEKAFTDTDCERLGIAPIREIKFGAFLGSKPRIIYVPSTQSVPREFFQGSESEAIHFFHPEFITEIGEGAFQFTPKLKASLWPPNCVKIPRNCFRGSGINYFGSLGQVRLIDDCAFTESGIKSLLFQESDNNDLYISASSFQYCNENYRINASARTDVMIFVDGDYEYELAEELRSHIVTGFETHVSIIDKSKVPKELLS